MPKELSTAIPRNQFCRSPNELAQLLNSIMHGTMSLGECIKALKSIPELDWSSYLDRYPDVRESGMDPALHFIKYGIIEGRQLLKTEFDVWQNRKVNPCVSIIVPNYNNAPYLPQSIGSLTGQTLPDIEIIIIDDASTDGSREILRAMAEKDARIKTIEFQVNQSAHMARKFGVMLASGDYIMFLDPDDYFSPDACQLAYQTARSGYDIVSFGVNVLASVEAQHQLAEGFAKYLNGGKAGEYRGPQIGEALLLKNAPCKTIWCKIFNAELAKAAFIEMADGVYPSAQDVYEITVLALNARAMLKINDRLYTYRLGSGHTTTTSRQVSLASGLEATRVIPLIEDYLKKAGATRYRDSLCGSMVERAIVNWLKEVSDKDCHIYFESMAARIGILEIIDWLIDHRAGQWQPVADKFAAYGNKLASQLKPRSIGIYYNIIGNGGAEQVIYDQTRLLVEYGYNVTVFLERAAPNDAKFLPEVNVVYLGGAGRGVNWPKSLLQGLKVALKCNPVDVMLCHSCYDGDLLWQTMLLKYLGIGVIHFPHNSFFRRLLELRSNYKNQDQEAILKCADKVPVLSRYEELYFRNLGINAEYFPNPVRLPEYSVWKFNPDFSARRSNIITFCRLGDPKKRVVDCLQILALALKHLPALKLTCVGSFENDVESKKFYNLAEELGISGKINVTGWIEDPRPYLDSAGVLLSTAWHESFSLTISEALGRGVPVVMYELPIEPALDNPAVISVERGDIRQAAAAVSTLLADERQWLDLTVKARQKVAQFGRKYYGKRLNNLLVNFHKFSLLRQYSANDYLTALETIGFFGAHEPPWQQ